MNPHLNLFCAYQKGDSGSFDGLTRLEDNLTRSFLATFKNLPRSVQHKFLKSIGLIVECQDIVNCFLCQDIAY